MFAHTRYIVDHSIYLSWHQFICSRRHLEAQRRHPADRRGTTCEVWKHVAVYGNIFTSTRVQTCSVTPALLGSVRECSHARSLTEQNTERFVLSTCTDVFKLGLNLSGDEESRLHPPRRSGRRAGLRFDALTLQRLCKSYQDTTAERHRCNTEWICDLRKHDFEENSSRNQQSMAVPGESLS